MIDELFLYWTAPSTSPRDLTPVLFSDSTSVTLNWQPPRLLSNGQVWGYFIYYTTDATLRDSEWVVDAVLGGSTFSQHQGPDVERRLTTSKVQAKNEIGAGPMSPTVIFRTPRGFMFLFVYNFFIVTPMLVCYPVVMRGDYHYVPLLGE